MKRLLHRLLAYEQLDGDGVAVYMHRWRLLALPGGRRVYLHWFVGPDWSEHPHDHPKRFLSIGLRGWYVERCPDRDPPDRVFTAPWVRTFPPTHRHAITEVSTKGCWTLVLVGRHQREWGFWPTPDCWVPWREYVFGKRRDC